MIGIDGFDGAYAYELRELREGGASSQKRFVMRSICLVMTCAGVLGWGGSVRADLVDHWPLQGDAVNASGREGQLDDRRQRNTGHRPVLETRRGTICAGVDGSGGSDPAGWTAASGV